MGCGAKRVNVRNRLAQILAHGKYAVEVRDDNNDDDDSLNGHGALCTCRCHASVTRTFLVNSPRTISVSVF